MQMNQKIFTLSLTTETLSCYLLLTGLADEEQPLVHELMESLWTGTPDDLEKALKALHKKGIIALPETQGEPLRLLPSEMWRD